MKLRYLCKQCKQHSRINSNAISRFELRDELGEEFRYKCVECAHSQNIHVNQVYAEADKKKTMIYLGVSLLLGMIATIFLWDLGFISTITLALPIGVYVLLSNQTNDSISMFNKSRL